MINDDGSIDYFNKKGYCISKIHRGFNENDNLKVRWFWKEDNKQWIAYDKISSDKIEKHFSENNGGELKLGNYLIDQKNRLQIKINSGFKREIMRGSWFYENDYGEFKPMDEKTSHLLENCFKQVKFPNSFFHFFIIFCFNFRNNLMFPFQCSINMKSSFMIKIMHLNFCLDTTTEEESKGVTLKLSIPK